MDAQVTDPFADAITQRVELTGWARKLRGRRK